MEKRPCNICLEDCRDSFEPEVRDASCVCVYTVHEACYNDWLSASNMAYNCIICHKTVSYPEVLEALNLAKRVVAPAWHNDYKVPVLILGGILLCSLLYDIALYLLSRWTLGRTVEVLLYALLIGRLWAPPLVRGTQNVQRRHF